MITLAEENYLKAILSISLNEDGKVSTNAIAGEIGTSAASVSDMLKKLQDKKLVKYKKYKGVSLTKKGNKLSESGLHNDAITYYMKALTKKKKLLEDF